MDIKKIASLILLFATATFGQTSTKNLVLHLPLDGNSLDQSTYANNGTNIGVTPTNDRFGNPNKAMYFNGSSYIQIPSSNSLNLTGSKTLSCWIYIPSYETQNMYPTLIMKDEPIFSSTYNLQINECSCYSSVNARYKFDYYFATGTTHYEIRSKELYTNYLNSWIHIATTYDSISGYCKLYLNGEISDSCYFGSRVANGSNMPLYIGTGKNAGYNQMFKGKIDDVKIFNSSLNKTDIYNLYMDNICYSSNRNDTTTYYVSSQSFKSSSPIIKYIQSDNLKTKSGNCDSIINRYAKFLFNDKICSSTNNIQITDTLILQLPTNNSSISSTKITVFPNPAVKYFNVDLGDFKTSDKYDITIYNEIGITIFNSTLESKSTIIDTERWSQGVYVVKISNSNNHFEDTKKLIIQ